VTLLAFAAERRAVSQCCGAAGVDARRPLLSIGVSYLHGDQQQTRMMGQTDGQTDSFIDHRCKNVQIKIKKVKTRKKRDKNKKRL